MENLNFEANPIIFDVPFIRSNVENTLAGVVQIETRTDEDRNGVLSECVTALLSYLLWPPQPRITRSIRNLGGSSPPQPTS